MSVDEKDKPSPDIWVVAGLEKRCQQLIQEGILQEKTGLDKLCQTINEEFKEKLSADGLQLNKRSVSAHLSELIWTTKTLDALKKAIQNNIPLAEFQKHYPYIPEKVLEEKAKFLTGVNDSHATARFVAGLGRLSTEDLPPDAELFEFPKNSYSNPFVITAGEEWIMAIINGPNIGIKHNRLIKDNPVRRALSDAQRRGDAAVVITNGLFMDLKKAAGAIKAYRAQVSGLRVKVEHLPLSYQDEARRILRDKPLNEIIFMPMEARFLGFLDAWNKITHRPDGSPEFTGTVLYPLGYNEEELINSAAYHEVRYITILKQEELAVRISLTKSSLKDAYKQGKQRLIKKFSRELDELIQRRAMTIISNVSEQDLERRRRRLRALLAKKLEEVIPNCKVVSQGSFYLDIGGHSVEINIPGNISITDHHLAAYGDEYGAKVFRNALARTVVICHPCALNYRMVGRDDYTDGQRDSATVHVAPICVDDAFLRDQLKDSTKAVHPISKVLRSEQFKPGVLVLSRVNGLVSGDAFPIAKLDDTANVANFVYPYPETKYIWVAEMTDLHFGGRSREHVWDQKNKRFLGVSEAVVEMMRFNGLLENNFPVHLLTINDDLTQGNHYETHKQPDPREMPYIGIERWMSERQEEIGQLAKKGDSAGVIQLTLDIAKFNLGQFLVRGLDWVQPQMLEVFTRLIDPNLDFFSAILGKALDSHLVFRGISDIARAPYDARDLGAISFGTGNHFESSVDKTLTEGIFYAYYARALLSKLPRWEKHPDFLERHVRAPLEGNAYFAWGTVKAPGGYEWALNFMSSPARLSSWSDPLGAVINNDRARGDFAGHMKGRVTLRTYGDKHFFAAANTPYSIYFMCAANTHTDRYGHHGFPPNNTGVGFVGLPADGPDAGPPLFRLLKYDYIRDWFAKPRPLNWAKLLPNPV